MRLDVLENGHRARVRVVLALARHLSRVEISDAVKALLYRPEFLGRPLLRLAARAMRGPSFWTAGEREYMAVATARWHECRFCLVTHTEMTRLASGGALDPADPRGARPELAAMLGLLGKVTMTPDSVNPVDCRPVRDAGMPGDAVVDALHVNLVCNCVDRLANAFGFRLRDRQLAKSTRTLHRLGYRLPGFLTGDGRAADPGGERYADLVRDLRQAVYGSAGVTDQAARLMAANGSPLPGLLESYATAVRDHSYQVTDADLARLLAAGHRQDEIFEITVAAAVGASLRSLHAGLRAVRGEPAR